MSTKQLKIVIAHALAVVMLLGCMTAGLGATFGLGLVKASAEDGETAGNALEISDDDEGNEEGSLTDTNPVPVWYWYDEDNTTLHLSGTNPGEESGYTPTTDSEHKWCGLFPLITDAQKYATNIVIDGPIKPSTTEYWFRNFSDVTSIIGLENLNTEDVTDMSEMFYGCNKLTSLDVSHFNTSEVRDMSEMFGACRNLTSLDVSNFNTSKVTDMHFMFDYCRSLTSLDVSHFNTSNVTDMRDMFNDCSSLTSLDVSGFNTSKVMNMVYMFNDCSSLTSLDVSGFDTSNVISMAYMFYDCSSLTSLDVSDFNTSKVSDMSFMFYACRNLTSLDVSHFNTSEVRDFMDMFAGCNNLTSLDVSNFNTSNVMTMAGMFADCSSLASIFSAPSTDWSNNGEGSMGMFSNCTSLEGGNGTQYDPTKTDETYACVDGLEDELGGRTGYFTAKEPNTAIVTFNTNGGTPAPRAQLIAVGETAAQPPVDPEKEGYTFVGWFGREGSAFDFRTPINSDTTLTAHWADDKNGDGEADTDQKFTVTYTDGEANGQAFTAQTTSDLSVEAATPAFDGTPAWDGHVFTGWDPSVQRNVRAEDCATGTTIITYTAQWEEEAEPTPEPTPAPDQTPAPSVAPGATAEAAEAAVLALASDSDPAGSMFAPLKAKSTKQTKKSVTLKWSGVGGAVRYVVYGNRCNNGAMQKLSETAGTSVKFGIIAGAAVKKGTYYKLIVVAIDGNNRVVSTSKVVHAASAGGKVGNHKKVTVKKAVTKKAKKLKAGKTLKLKAKAVKKKLKVKKHAKAVRYESSNPAVATVTDSGKVRGVSKGSCVVYAYTQNGVSKAVKVTVK